MARGMWGLKLVALVLGLLVMVPETRQQSFNHPHHALVRRISEKQGPFLGLVIADSNSDERLLLESGYFIADPYIPDLVIAGRKFNIGTFRGVSAVYVRAGGILASAGVTVQILLDTFPIAGIINYGKSGSTSDKLGIGYVVVPTHVSYIGVWGWNAYASSLKLNKDLASLYFGDYNLPEAGENKLESITFQQVRKYTPKSSKKQTFWFYIDRKWLQIANEIQPSDPEDSLPTIVHGLRSGSSDIFVENAAFADFLNGNLNISAVDTISSAVVSTAVANGVPQIVFRGISNKAGVSYTSEESLTAGKNVLKVVAAFVDRLSLRKQPHISLY